MSKSELRADVSVPILSRICNIFESNPWGIEQEFTPQLVREAAAQGRVCGTPMDGLTKTKPDANFHIERIAYFLTNPSTDPISIDVGVPTIGCHVAWPVDDGNHRLAAAILNGQATIPATIGGSIPHAIQLLDLGRQLGRHLTKTQRLLTSFQSVDILPEHRNSGHEGPALRDFGFGSSVATALIRWGEQHDLVCTFETSSGRSNNAYSWMEDFLEAAVAKHLEIFGEVGQQDLPQKMVDYLEAHAAYKESRARRPRLY